MATAQQYIEKIWADNAGINCCVLAMGTAVVELAECRPLPLPSDVDLHGNFDGVINLDPEIPHRTFNF